MDFEGTIVEDYGAATVPWWNLSGSWGSTNFLFNWVYDETPSASVVRGDSQFWEPIQGNYTVYLQGGSAEGGRIYGTNGVSISQIGRIPSTARSLIYDADASLQVSFNGQRLWPVALSNGPNYTVWGVNVYQYGEQTGELRFTAPWLTMSILDDIRLSPVIVPEPSVWALCGLSVLSLLGVSCWRARRLPALRGPLGPSGTPEVAGSHPPLVPGGSR